MLIGKVVKCILVVCVVGILSEGIIAVLPSSVSAISWGKMDAQTDYEGIYYLKRYDSGQVNLSIIYTPYFTAYFPIWVEVMVTENPSWLTATPSQSTFLLHAESSKTIPIMFLVNTHNVEPGSIGRVALQITGEPLRGGSLRQIDPAKVYFLVGYNQTSLSSTVDIILRFEEIEVKNTPTIKGFEMILVGGVAMVLLVGGVFILKKRR